MDNLDKNKRNKTSKTSSSNTKVSSTKNSSINFDDFAEFENTMNDQLENRSNRVRIPTKSKNTSSETDEDSKDDTLYGITSSRSRARTLYDQFDNHDDEEDEDEDDNFYDSRNDPNFKSRKTNQELREEKVQGKRQEKRDKALENVLDVTRVLFGAMVNCLITCAILLMAYNLITGGFNFGKQYAMAVTADTTGVNIIVTIPDNSTVREASKILEENGIIPSAILYELEQMIFGYTSPYKGGSYTLNSSMDSIDVARMLRVGDNVNTDVTITIPEGWTVSQIADYLEENEIVTAVEFLEACKTSVFDFSFIEDIPDIEIPFEGYLFPDTYFITASANSREIITKLLSRFSEIFFDDTINILATATGLTMHEVITMASIIEKEAPNSNERYKMSALLHNRLEAGMPLEIQSVLAFGLGKRRSELTAEDYETNSAYNVYYNTGLPVGPICNPGRDSILAVLMPEADADYLYYLISDQSLGTYYFTGSKTEYQDALNNVVLTTEEVEEVEEVDEDKAYEMNIGD